jgi:2-deoxy-scyllo-inosose synthase
MTVSSVAPAVAPATLDRVVQIGDHRYPFHVRADGWPELAERACRLEADRFAIVFDPRLPDGMHRAAVTCFSSLGVPVDSYPAPAGEDGKTPAAVQALMDAITSNRATRRTVLVALGGGLAGNVAGKAAAEILRGIRFVQLPTTPLAMSDSTLSGKQAVNGPYGKNHYGTFHWPEFVWCELGFLDGIPPDLYRQAWCELVKNVIGILPKRYDWTLERLRPAADYTHSEVVDLIDFCITAKTHVMRRDEHECREALVLELGHTFGHALELLTHGRVQHGYAIGLGLLVAAQVAVNAGYLNPSAMEAHRALLAANGPLPALPTGLPTSALIDVIRYDNKRGYLDAPPPHPDFADMVLLEDLGRPRRNVLGGLITQVPLTDAAAAIDQALRT